jgi:hypothetical protein
VIRHHHWTLDHNFTPVFCFGLHNITTVQEFKLE